MNKSLIPSFIARSASSLEDFIDSDICKSNCRIYCQFSAASLDVSIMRRLVKSGVLILEFSNGDLFVRETGCAVWVDRKGIDLRVVLGTFEFETAVQPMLTLNEKPLAC